MAKNLVLWLIIAAVIMAVVNSFEKPENHQKLDYSEFVKEVQSGRVSEVA